MRVDRIEGHWIDAFSRVFERCEVRAGEACAVLSDARSREDVVALASLALQRLGADPFHLRMVSRSTMAPIPARSAAASDPAAPPLPSGRPTNAAPVVPAPIVAALAGCGFVADCTLAGLFDSPALQPVLAGGARVLTIANLHPDTLVRLLPDTALEPAVREGLRLLDGARRLQVTSRAGTQLVVSMDGARVAGLAGYATQAGSHAQWPGGLCLGMPVGASANGLVVSMPGDLDLGLSRYVGAKTRLLVQNGFVTDIAGDGIDAQLLRSRFDDCRERDTLPVAHVGWGLNRAARWDSLHASGDADDAELRTLAGSFLFAIAPTQAVPLRPGGRFELSLRHCTVALDDHVVVDAGRLTGAFG